MSAECTVHVLVYHHILPPSTYQLYCVMCYSETKQALSFHVPSNKHVLMVASEWMYRHRYNMALDVWPCVWLRSTYFWQVDEDIRPRLAQIFAN